MAKDFMTMLNDATAAYDAAEQERKRKQEELWEAEKVKAGKGKELVRLQRLAYLAGHERDPLAWRPRKWEPNQFWNDWEWKELWELETAELLMSVELAESKNHKKFKYFVTVHAWRTELSEEPGTIHGGYRSTDYGKDKYMRRIGYGKHEVIPGQEMSKSFAKLEDAKDFAETWKKRLEDDHAAEIAADRTIRDMAKAAGVVYDPHYRKPGFWQGYGAIVPIAEKRRYSTSFRIMGLTSVGPYYKKELIA